MLHSRIKRVNHLLQNTIGEILQNEITDPRLGFVTVCHVDVSKDLRKAVVFVSVFTDSEEAQANALEALDSARGYIKSLLSQRVVLKFLPDLQFRLHKGASHAARIDSILREMAEPETPHNESEPNKQ